MWACCSKILQALAAPRNQAKEVIQPPQAPPIQPPLIGNLTGALVAFAAFLIAGLAVLMASDRFDELNIIVQLFAVLAIFLALFSAVLSLFSLTAAINLARIWEKDHEGGNDEKISWWRRLSATTANISTGAITLGALCTAVVIGAFAFSDNAANSSSYRLEVNVTRCAPTAPMLDDK